MLRPGGRLVYSTCTFSPDENEGSISRFIERFPDFTIEKVHVCDCFAGGRGEWVENPAADIANTFRLWPHLLWGEGHYVAVLKKQSDCGVKANRGVTAPKCDTVPEYESFCKDALINPPTGSTHLFGEQLYLLPEESFPLQGMKVLRPGLHLGTVKKNRFEPSHSLALALNSTQVRRAVDFKADSPEIFSYLQGNSLRSQSAKGWTLVTADGYSVGWGKCSDGVIKNHYPKGLRRV